MILSATEKLSVILPRASSAALRTSWDRSTRATWNPTPNLEYIYDHGTVFCEGLSDLPTEYACRGRKIAVNVRKQKDGYSCRYSFNFIDDETKKEYHTHYGWSLIPNTCRNLLRA
jgi:hypothetical protein